MTDQIPASRPPRRKIDFDRIGNKILVLLYQRYMESNSFFVLFSDVATAIPTEPKNAIWDEVHDLISHGKIIQKTESRVVTPSGFGALAGLGSGGPQTYEAKVDGYKISRGGIDAINKLSDEAYEILTSEIALVQEAPQQKNQQDSWEPLPLDRQSTEFAKAVEAAETALKEIEGSNGYADANPLERNSIVESIKAHLKALKEGLVSRGQIIEGLIKPFKFIAVKFADASIGDLASRAAKFLWTLIVGI